MGHLYIFAGWEYLPVDVSGTCDSHKSTRLSADTEGCMRLEL